MLTLLDKISELSVTLEYPNSTFKSLLLSQSKILQTQKLPSKPSITLYGASLYLYSNYESTSPCDTYTNYLNLQI